jgi:hypothetical protein
MVPVHKPSLLFISMQVLSLKTNGSSAKTFIVACIKEGFNLEN